MRSWWCLIALVACSKKAEAPFLDDEWVSHPVEKFSGKLDKDISFTIELPKGMFHDPTSTPIVGQHYGRWKESQLEDHAAPGAAVYYSPAPPATVDDAKKTAPAGEQVVAAEALPGGGFTVTTRGKGNHSWHVEQTRYTPSHDAVWCVAWRVDEDHQLGEPSRQMLEKMCNSLTFGP